jgi:DNA-binding response OmpR family regulator
MNSNPEASGDNAAAAPASGGTNSSCRILVVDDDADARLQSTEVLTHHGYHVDAAEDGAVAWDTLQVNDYDLVVTDHKMPKVTGVELVEKLRAARMALPVILVSGAIPTDELNRHPGLRLAATLLKPFTADELVLAVKEVLCEANDFRQSTSLPYIEQTRPPAESGLGM